MNDKHQVFGIIFFSLPEYKEEKCTDHEHDNIYTEREYIFNFLVKQDRISKYWFNTPEYSGIYDAGI